MAELSSGSQDGTSSNANKKRKVIHLSRSDSECDQEEEEEQHQEKFKKEVQSSEVTQSQVMTLGTFVQDLTTARTDEDQFAVFLQYFGNKGNLISSETMILMYASLPNPCPRRKRAWEWDRLSQIIDLQEMDESFRLEFRMTYCRFLGSNGYNSSITCPEIFDLFGAWLKDGVEEEHVARWCRECEFDFQELSSDEQVNWEVQKWLYSRVPRPEFLVVLLLMFEVICVEEDDKELGGLRADINMKKVAKFLHGVGFRDEEDVSYLKKQVTKRKILKVYQHGFVKQNNDNKVRERGLHNIYQILKEPLTQEEKLARRRKWYHENLEQMSDGTWL